MKSMKITAADRKAKEAKYDKPCSIGGDKYPYGLRIHLDEEIMEKLDMASLPRVGAKMILTAEVDVDSVEARESTDGGKRRSMAVQITAMELKPKGTAKDAIDAALKKA